jgi:transcription regulator MmyB-like protein
VLDAISRTLQFDAHEHSHLFTLAGLPTSTIANQCLSQQCPTAQALIDQLEPFPAGIFNDRLDLLPYDRVFASFFGGKLETIPADERNCLWLAFTHPSWRRTIVDWDETVGNMVAEYRAAMAEHLDDPEWKVLVDRLHRVSPEFTAFWERHDVQLVESRMKRARHPTAGLLSLMYTHMWLGQRLGTRITAFTRPTSGPGASSKRSASRWRSSLRRPFVTRRVPGTRRVLRGHAGPNGQLAVAQPSSHA